VQAPKPQPRALTAEERQAVRNLMNSESYQDESVRVVHAKELNAGRVLASVSTMYRVLRATGETRERRPQRPAQRHAIPRLQACAPNEAWTWDITKLPTWTPRVYLNLYVILDLFSRYPVGWMISRKENAALAKHLFEQVIASHGVPPGQLTVHQDRGAPMIAHTYRELLSSLGVERSYSRPRVSNDNPFSESHFKTLKYTPSYPGRFTDIDDARHWVAAFMLEYQHRPHEGLAFYTPADVFHGRVEAIHQARLAALDAHWALHPQRYPNGPPQSKRPPAVVAINPTEGVVGADTLLDHIDRLVHRSESVQISAATENVM
jgi:putative transposase